MSVPYSFVTNFNSSYEQPKKQMVKEWAKFRYGIFDEVGYTGDKIYLIYFKSDGRILPSGTSNIHVIGNWSKRDTITRCNPEEDNECFFLPRHIDIKSDLLIVYLPSHTKCKIVLW